MVAKTIIVALFLHPGSGMAETLYNICKEVCNSLLVTILNIDQEGGIQNPPELKLTSKFLCHPCPSLLGYNENKCWGGLVSGRPHSYAEAKKIEVANTSWWGVVAQW